MNLLKRKLQIFVTLVFLGYAIWWVSFRGTIANQGLTVQWYGGTYGVMALIGAVIGFFVSSKWGGYKTVLGRALIFFSLGLLAQEAGQLIYTYYIYGAKIQIPYPSWGDVAYFGSVLLYIYATYLLSKAAGIRFSLKKGVYKIVAVVVPVVLLAISFFVLLHNHQYDYSHPITVFLDFGYPIGQAIYISLAITAYLLSRKLLGGVMKSGIILIILAMTVQYISDFTFVYQNSRKTYISGDIVDLLYLVSYFVAATALIRFYCIYRSLKENNGVKETNNA